MPVSVQERKYMEVRIYDGTAVTPFYVPVTVLDPPTFPLIPPRPTTEVGLGGGIADANNIYTFVSNEEVIFQPLEFSMRFRVQAERLGLMYALGNINGGTWTVGSDTWVPVVAANLGTRVNSSGTAVAAPGPKDQVQIDAMYNIVVKHTAATDAPAGEDLVVEYKGCVTTDAQIVAEDIFIFAAFTGVIYGGIDMTLADFPTGTESTLPT